MLTSRVYIYYIMSIFDIIKCYSILYYDILILHQYVNIQYHLRYITLNTFYIIHYKLKRTKISHTGTRDCIKHEVALHQVARVVVKDKTNYILSNLINIPLSHGKESIEKRSVCANARDAAAKKEQCRLQEAKGRIKLGTLICDKHTITTRARRSQNEAWKFVYCNVM